MYTIKQTTICGEYYLCKGWRNNKNWINQWVIRENLKNKNLFKRKQDAKGSLYKWLKYWNDNAHNSFSIIQIEDINNPNTDVLCDYYYLQDEDFDN